MAAKKPRISRQQPEIAPNSRDKLLNAASLLMNERNSLEISLSEISKKARVNSALVKYHFGNKHGLLVAVIERNVGQTMGALEALVDADLSAGEKLRRHIAGLINLYFRYRYLNTLVRAVLRDSNRAQAKDISDRLLKPAVVAQRRILEQGAKSGEFRKVDPMMFYMTIIGACDVFLSCDFPIQNIFKRTSVDDALRRNFIDHTSAIVVRGLARG